jgi:NADH-quinone oxidoreductase subunit G
VRGKRAKLATALGKAASLLKDVDPEKLAVLLSAQHSNEDNFALLRLARDYLGTGHLYISGRPMGVGDDVLRHQDKNPNTAGVLALCTSTPPKSFPELAKDIEEGRVTHVLALGSYATDETKVEALSKLDGLVALCTHEGPIAKKASVLLPASSWAESDGTFVNAKGMIQESEKAVAPQGDSAPAWKVVGSLCKELGFPMGWTKLSQVHKAMQPEAGASVAMEAGAVG